MAENIASYTPNNYLTRIPSLGDGANIQTALRQFYYGVDTGFPTSDSAISAGIAGLIKARAPISNPNFTGNATFGGDVSVGGNLTITGNTTINSASLTVDDKNIEINSIDSPTNLSAMGGGITLKGDTDKTIMWTGSPAMWTISDGVNLKESDNDYRIANNVVLNSTSVLGITATNIALKDTSQTFSGNQTFSGTIAVGANSLGTVTAGRIENDGNVFYATPKVTATTRGRGLVPTQSMLKLQTSYTPTTLSKSGTSGSVEAVYYALNNKTLYLASSTTYFVEMYIQVQHTIAVSLPTGANASLTFGISAPNTSSMEFDIQSQWDMASGYGTATAMTAEYISGLGITRNIKSVNAPDTGYSTIRCTGFVKTGTTAGNFGPYFYLYIVNPSGGSTSVGITVGSASWCKVTPIGVSDGAEKNIGGWA